MRDREGAKIGLLAVVAIGIGGMVGGGIFAVLGLAVGFAHGATPLAFALAGGVALLTAYSYAKLSVAYPSRGGTITFLDRSFGSGMFTGSLNVMLWLNYVIMLSLYAVAFGSYAATFLPEGWQSLGRHLFISACVLAITGLNILRAEIIGKAENWIVGLKIAILLVFVGVGLFGIDRARLAPGEWASPLQIIAGAMIIFLAYEGFELIANTAEDVRDPGRVLPRALFISVGFVIVLYVLVSVVAVGNLSVEKISAASDYALAEAAKPFLGQTGFTLIAIAAMLSTASAINATLYGASRLSYAIARDGELPAGLERKVWGRPIEGLLITAGLTLAIANAFDVGSISTVGSSGFLIIFAAVNTAAAKQARVTGGHRWLSGMGVAACLAAWGVLVEQTLSSTPRSLWLIAGVIGASILIEGSFRVGNRELRLRG